MRLRRFRDPTLQGAMAQLRAAMGPEALILATRRVAGGIELTAALDQSDAAAESQPAEPGREAIGPFGAGSSGTGRSGTGRSGAGLPDRYGRDDLGPAAAPPRSLPIAAAPREVEGEEARLAQLDWHGVPVALARRLRAGPLAFGLSLALRFAPLDLADPTPILLAGPPGAGKTLTVVRLAARLVLAGVRPVVVCADSARAGAAEQLAPFTRLLGIDLLEVSGAAEAAAALRDRPAATPALIDTAGGDPWQQGGTAALRGLAAATGARMVAVLPAGLDPAEAADLAGGYAELGAGALIATRLDMARRLGGVLSAAATGLAFVEAGVGAGAADGLVPATPDLLARRLLAPLPGRGKERWT